MGIPVGRRCSMTLTDKERAFLHELVKQTLEQAKKEGDTVIHHWNVQFLAAEQRFEDFLEGLLKKL